MNRVPKWFKTALKLSVVVALVASLGPTPAMSQDVAVGQATANVQAVLAVTAPAALRFGNVYQGIAKSKAKDSDSAAVFNISGEAAAEITCYLQLPEFLAGGTGNDRMAIVFSATDAGYVEGAIADGTGWVGGTAVTFNPRSTLTDNLSAGGAGSVVVGGKVIPSVNQTTGALYTGDIVLTVSYTGS